jgi:hypothetical protein
MTMLTTFEYWFQLSVCVFSFLPLHFGAVCGGNGNGTVAGTAQKRSRPVQSFFDSPRFRTFTAKGLSEIDFSKPRNGKVFFGTKLRVQIPPLPPSRISPTDQSPISTAENLQLSKSGRFRRNSRR